MHQSEHAQEMATRFKEIFEQSGDEFSAEHYDELVLLIEAGLDTAMVSLLEKIADKLTSLAHDIRNDAEFFT
jgi:hypothetical protein